MADWMVKNMKIMINAKNVEYRSGETLLVDAGCCIYIEGLYFPDLEWTDLVYPLLPDWISVILEALTDGEDEYELWFYDGSYYLQIKGEKRIKVKCIYDNNANQELKNSKTQKDKQNSA